MTDKGERPQRLMRIKPKRILGGVCAGFAYWFGLPTWLVRVLAIFTGIPILAYIILWIFMPATDELPSDYDERTH
jgi:phage shock protein PspC (stress-responsive transcriptional regulator)